MAAISQSQALTALRDIYPDAQLLQLLDKNVPEIALNFKTHQYVFTRPVVKQALIDSSDLVLAGAAVGMVAGGVCGVIAGARAGKTLSGMTRVILYGSSATAGATVGAVATAVYVVVKGSIKLYQIDRSLEETTLKTNEVMKEFFSMYSMEEEGGSPTAFFCPISHELFHLPVDTGCNIQRDENGQVMLDPEGKIIRTGEAHIFEFNSLRVALEESTSNICPFRGCQKEVNWEEVSFAMETREKVHSIVTKSFSHLVQPGAMSVDYRGRELKLLANCIGICDRWKKGTSTSDDLSFLNYLVRKIVNSYNERVMKVNKELMNSIETVNSIGKERTGQQMAVVLLTQNYLIDLPEQLPSVDISDEKEQEEV